MRPVLHRVLLRVAFPWAALVLTASTAAAAASCPFRLAPSASLDRLDEKQIRLLEKLNRADRAHLPALGKVILPGGWDLDELEYSPMPRSLGGLQQHGKLLAVHIPSQVFGAYEHGQLIRWGPLSSGRARYPTPPGKVGARRKEAALEVGNPYAQGIVVKVQVNGVYPNEAPRSYMPPTLLFRLPALPEELAYRFVGRDLILPDREAALIVDFNLNALENNAWQKSS